MTTAWYTLFADDVCLFDGRAETQAMLAKASELACMTMISKVMVFKGKHSGHLIYQFFNGKQTALPGTTYAKRQKEIYGSR